MRARGALAAVLILMAGCATTTSPAQEEPAGPDPVSQIEAVGEKVLVSTPGNRIAEFMVAQNPTDPDHLVTAFGDYDSPGGVLNCAFAASFDGGRSWTVSEPVPGFSGPYLQFDGWVDFDEHGGVHAICLRQAGPEATTEAWPFHFRSSDGGLTWSEPTRIPSDPPGRSTDKSVLGVSRDGTVYGAVSGLVARSWDNGTTWDPLRQVEPGFSQLNGIVEDNSGTIHLLGAQGGDVVVQRSHDGGQTWNASVVGPYDIAPGYNDQNRWVDQRPWDTLPVIDHDPVTDDLYVAVMSWDTSAGAYRSYLYRSVDGVTYEEVPIPDFSSPTCAEPCHVTHPSIGFDLQGRVGLLVQLTQDGGHLKEVYFSASGDAGRTWLPAFELSKTDGIGQQGWTNPQALAPPPQNAVAIAQGVASRPQYAHNAAAGVALSTAVSELQLRWNGEYWDITGSEQGFVAMWIEHNDDGKPELWSRILAAH